MTIRHIMATTTTKAHWTPDTEIPPHASNATHFRSPGQSSKNQTKIGRLRTSRNNKKYVNLSMKL